MDIPELCTEVHPLARGLRVPHGLIQPTIEQTASLPKLPVELILPIFKALQCDPVAQIALAMTCKKLLAVSAITPIRTCCVPPGSIHRALLLLYIHPRKRGPNISTYRSPSPSPSTNSSSTSMLDVIPAWSSRNPDIASRSPDWHICEACGMLRPTAPAYWAKKKRQFTYMRFDGSERTWDAAAVRFCSKTDMIAPACPECVAGSPLAGLRFWFRQNKLRDSGGGGGGGGGGFRELTWKDVARGL